jgi:hypothetical protein
MTNKEKTLVINALTYTESPSYWGINNVKNYLRLLQQNFKEVLITITPKELRNRIFQWINKCDPDLKIFFKFNKVREQEKGKIYQLYDIPVAIEKDISNILSKQTEIPYDALGVGTWDIPKLVFSKRNGNVYEMWYAVKATKHATKSFTFDKLSQNVQSSLVSILQNDIPDMDELEKIRLEYNIFDRIINIVTFDTSQYKVSISTDQPKLIDPDDGEKNIVRPEDRLVQVFDKILTSIGVSKKHTKIISKQKRVNFNTIKRIKVKESKSLLLFPFRFDIVYNAGDLTASNVTKFPKLTTSNIFPIVQEYYKLNNTFKDFFKNHPNFDAQKNSDLLKHINSLPNTNDEAEGFFLFIVIDSGIHLARVICNITTGSLRIFFMEGKGSYEYIKAELDKIFS